MNIVYIDVQNTHQATRKLGRLIDRAKFYRYLKDHCNADIVYFAVGYLHPQKKFYDGLVQIGYTMLYKEVSILSDGSVKGNVDIDIAIKSVIELFHKKLTTAFLVTNDGDYNTLIKTFQEYNVWGFLITPDIKSAAKSIKKLSKKIVDLQDIRSKIEKNPTTK